MNRDGPMTTEYLIRAWCDRPFTTYLYVTADSPERAVALARERQDELLDAAEECNRDYPWDEFAAYDENGDELLRILDTEARLRVAAPELLAACRMVVDRWERGDLAEAARACAAAIDKCGAGAAGIPGGQAQETLPRLTRRRASQGRVPPDPERMNDKRSAWAATALAAFIDETGTDEEDAVCDLTADLMHWCDRHGYDFAAELARGQAHYEAETSGQESTG
jgi:hypothetical protein